MGTPYPIENDPGTAQRKPDGPQDPNRGRTIRGECHDSVTGELYAFALDVTSAGPDSIASFKNGISGVLESLGLECSVSLRPLGDERAWDGTNRV